MQAHFPKQRLVIEPNRDRSFSLDRDLYVSHFSFLMSGILSVGVVCGFKGLKGSDS